MQNNIEYAEQIVNEFMKPVHKFISGKVNNYHDSEDLVQEICIKIFNTLYIRDDIASVEKYVWTIAHNCLNNYYKGNGRSRQYIGIGIDEVEYMLTDESNPEDDYIYAETIKMLHNEIAYLSKTQREIVVLYYYDGLKQTEIAEKLDIAVGTVKWYLSEAKTELKKGMEIMRTNELKFNPIKFSIVGVSGASSDETVNYLNQSLLAQNISYCAYRDKLAVNEIADKLGVSPVYIENELELLEKYGLIKNESDKYITNFIIQEATKEIVEFSAKMYGKAAETIAVELYDTLMNSDILNSDDIYYPNGDKNFLMWSLIPFILANSGGDFKDKIDFKEVATTRIEGGENILLADIEVNGVQEKHAEHFKDWCGPMWNGVGDYIFWQCNHEWCERKYERNYADNVRHDMAVMGKYLNKEDLSKENYAHLIEKGYILGEDSNFKPAIVILNNIEIKEKLLNLGNDIKMKYEDTLKEYKEKYIELVLSTTPKNVRKMWEYMLQYIFYADGKFLLYSLVELLNRGKLKPVYDNRKKSMTTLILPSPKTYNNRFLI